MNYLDVVKRLAPCGLDCSRCASYANSEIQRLSRELKEQLGNFGRIARLRAEDEPVYNNYPQFLEMLDVFIESNCSGCRGDNDLCPITCRAKECVKEKGIDFCFQCDEYPCQEMLEGYLGKRFKRFNDEMKEKGAVEYYIRQVQNPRYE